MTQKQEVKIIKLKAAMAVNYNSRAKLIAKLRLCDTFLTAISCNFEQLLDAKGHRSREQKIKMIRQFIEFALRESKISKKMH